MTTLRLTPSGRYLMKGDEAVIIRVLQHEGRHDVPIILLGRIYNEFSIHKKVYQPATIRG